MSANSKSWSHHTRIELVWRYCEHCASISTYRSFCLKYFNEAFWGLYQPPKDQGTCLWPAANRASGWWSSIDYSLTSAKLQRLKPLICMLADVCHCCIMPFTCFAKFKSFMGPPPPPQARSERRKAPLWAIPSWALLAQSALRGVVFYRPQWLLFITPLWEDTLAHRSKAGKLCLELEWG